MNQETVDAVLGQPVGVPPTGLYGLIDLIGLDVMELVGTNLAVDDGYLGVDGEYHLLRFERGGQLAPRHPDSAPRLPVDDRPVAPLENGRQGPGIAGR
ncbi:MAG: hypothetical protein GY745_11040 [Actinomycetia bacterium]|nr:hypothetical protein [Actinomycetes bacterium]MCP3912327.1 hypothetical protein [Actinomycetes bacterium]MCP4085573.1 hypothetical protein [Actinomycetes bacterium]